MPQWIMPGFAEGFFMAVVKLFGHAEMGKYAPTLSEVLWATGLVGLAQMLLAGGVLALRRRTSPDVHIFTHGGYVVRSLGFGFSAMLATVCAFAAFQNGARADVGANTFIVAVLPIFATALWGVSTSRDERLDSGQLGGLAIALVGALLVTTPALRPGNNPIWIVYSLGTMLGATATRLVVQDIKKCGRREHLPALSPWVMQFWGGAAMACALLIAALWKGTVSVPQFSVFGFWQAFAVTAVGNTLWWMFRLYAVPQDGTPLCVKELAAGTVYLTTATFGGYLVAGDTLPVQKVFGLALAVLASFFAQKQAREYCSRFVTRNITRKIPLRPVEKVTI